MGTRPISRTMNFPKRKRISTLSKFSFTMQQKIGKKCRSSILPA